MEKGEDTGTSKRANNKVVIQIPSYQDVAEGFLNSSAHSSQTQSFFKPSQSFSQAFKFLKDSECYSPPPPPAASAAESINASTSQSGNAPTSVSINNASTATPSSLPVRGRRSILVSHRQKGNPLLKHIRNVKWEFSDVICDYLLGQNSCALYLSLRYHLLHPDYIYYRIRELQKNYRLRVILCHVDVEDAAKPLLEVTKTALLHDCTLFCAWSLEECGRYLETIKMYENKPADMIQGQMDTDYVSRLNHVLTSVRRVNKTDVVTLGSTFGSLANIMDASMEDLARCPGIGERKVKSLYDTFHEPFKRAVVRASEPTAPGENEASGQNEECAAEDGEDEDARRRKKEPALTVKSALSAAFAKHASKFSKRTKRSQISGEDSALVIQDKEGSVTGI